MTLEECYTAAGADYEDVMRRFVTEERVDRFLGMFLRDPSYVLLCEAMEGARFEDAFRAAHTLKGICMNLSLTALLEASVALTDDLRVSPPGPGLGDHFAAVQAEYRRTAAAVGARLT